MAEAFSDEEIRKIEAELDSIESSKVTIVHAQVPVKTEKDRRFLDTITARDEKLKNVESDLEDYKYFVKQRNERIADQTAEIERLRGALEPFALFTMSVTFKKSKDRFVKAVFAREDFRKARKAFDAGKE